MTTELYADVVLPLAQSLFTYRVGSALVGELEAGQCVEVSLGKRKVMLGIVWRIHSDTPPYKTIKTIERRVPHSPVISCEQRTFWEWIASYYMCTIGEVMRAALPSALKPEGFSADEFSADGYHPRTVKMLSLHPSIDCQEALNSAFERLKRARKQHDALLSFAELSSGGDMWVSKIPRSAIECDAAALGALVKKEIFVLFDEQVAQEQPAALPTELPLLTEAQSEIFDSIKDQFLSKDTVLLHGVTGSGKTEIYIQLIAETLAAGRDALYLLPEIALTAQLIRRMERYFGRRVITYHSKFTERQRTDSYMRAAAGGGGHLIMGVRSAIFMPVHNLGLVVVDEEHESSFKQTDPAPRYNARDCAIVLASIYNAKTVLGSATPSVESYTNATNGRYGIVTLSQRFSGAALPQITISNVITAARRGERQSHFNKILVDKIEESLSREQQVILFQNRRGFSPYVECPQCGWTVSCPHCNVTLTLHKSENSLNCHYCGHKQKSASLCPACSKADLEPRGFGTEKVEQELERLFPQARIARLDRDTAQTQRSFNAIISSFESGQTNILIGTQMVTKGFDFEKVSLVGILNADNLLTYPDFRASERAFQLITQVAGRAGRRQTQGEVIIQTSQPENRTIRQAAAGDYMAMIRSQLVEREQFNYPPYCRIVSLTLRHRDKALLWRAAAEIARQGQAIFGNRILGPQPPPVDRIKNEHIVSFILKVERSVSFAKAKERMLEIVTEVIARSDFRNITIAWNVDPQ